MGLAQLFNPPREDVWQEFAQEFGGVFHSGAVFGSNSHLTVKVGPWSMTVDTFRPNRSPNYTRARLAFFTPDNFEFETFHKDIFSGISKLLGMQDIEVGYPAFDEEFIIRGNSEDQVRRLFSNPNLIQLIPQHPSIHFSVCRNDMMDLFESLSLPREINVLRFKVPEVINDINWLRGVHMLMGETMNTLYSIGSATTNDPQIPFYSL